MSLRHHVEAQPRFVRAMPKDEFSATPNRHSTAITEATVTWRDGVYLCTKESRPLEPRILPEFSPVASRVPR